MMLPTLYWDYSENHPLPGGFFYACRDVYLAIETSFVGVTTDQKKLPGRNFT